MTRLTRREFLRTSGTSAGALAIAGLSGCAMFRGNTDATSNRRVVVIGGGWGGATAAKYVRLADPGIEVVLLEPNRKFVSCPFSNLVLSGVRALDELTFGYDGLREHGVRSVHEAATAIEPDHEARAHRRGLRSRTTASSSRPASISCGTRSTASRRAGDKVLHAWKAGPQTVELAQQLAAMPDGGVFVLTIPPAAYRCPPGPYERTCQIAWYLKTNKPKAKLIVLDANQNIVSQDRAFPRGLAGVPEHRLPGLEQA